MFLPARVATEIPSSIENFPFSTAKQAPPKCCSSEKQGRDWCFSSGKEITSALNKYCFKTRRRLLKTTFVRTLIVLSIIAIAGSYSWITATSPTKNLILEAFRQVSTGGYVDFVAHGNLGGMPVAFRDSEISWLEYDDEEAMRRRKQAFPDPRKRTTRDAISSFSFRMVYPQLPLGERNLDVVF